MVIPHIARLEVALCHFTLYTATFLRGEKVYNFLLDQDICLSRKQTVRPSLLVCQISWSLTFQAHDAHMHLQVKRCKTDAYDGLQFDNPDRPECTNLLTLYQLASGRSREEITAECASMRWGAFKPLLTDALVEHLRPVQTK